MSLDRRKFLVIGASAATMGIIGQQAITASGTAEKHEGKRYGMIIDLKKCEKNPDCTKCIDACHVSHNVPDIENKDHEIKWIWKEPFKNAFIEQDNQHLPKKFKHKKALLLCNHCDNPPCVRVCPTGATWSRKSDGIVMMDWHRCVGCRYCIAACPYGSRSFNFKDPRKELDKMTTDFPTRSKGVVEKCTFCDERLARGEKPACSDACTERAIVFGDLEDPNSDIRKILDENYSVRRKPELGTQPEVYYLI